MLATQLNLLINHNRLLLHMQIMMLHVDELGDAGASRFPGYCARLQSERSGFEPQWRGDIVLCSWARHFNLTVPLSTHKWVSVNLMLEVTLRWTSIPSRGE